MPVGSSHSDSSCQSSQDQLSEVLGQHQVAVETMMAKLNSPVVTGWLSSRRQNMRPWLQFSSVSNFEKPETIPKWSKRLVQNLSHFQTNYFCITLVLLAYCLLTSPILLIALGAVAGGCHMVKKRQQEQKLVIAGREIPLVQQYVGVALLSVPVLLVAGASAALFWVIGASFFVVMLHATFFKSETLVADGGEDAELFEIVGE